MWQKKQSKLELVASMVRQVMPEFSEKKQVIILCDSWYTKQNLISVIDECPNLALIGNAKSDSVLYDPAPERTGRRGRPAKHGRQLSLENDFTLSDEKNRWILYRCTRGLQNFSGSGKYLPMLLLPGKRIQQRFSFSASCFGRAANFLRIVGKRTFKPCRK